MRAILRSIFSDGSNVDLDFSKILGAVAFLFFLIFSFYAYGYKGSTFNPMEWTTAVGLLIGAAGGVSKLKDNSAPPK